MGLLLEQIQLTVFVLDNVIRYYQHKPVYLCFVDFTKAFDYINKNALYYKLIQQNIGDKMLKVIISMYDIARARVNHMGSAGNSTDTLQGGILSPKLFNEFLFDLPKYLDKSNGISINNLILTHILCADDIVLLADSAKDLQNNLNALLGFCKKWHLIVNVKKTKIMEKNKRMIAFGAAKQIFARDDMFTQPLIGSSTP